MNFAASVFTLEVNLTPTLAFEAKWAADAEAFGFGWARENAERFATKGSHGTDLPAVVKVRIARSPERAAYLAGEAASVYQEIKIVYLVEPSSLGIG